MTAHRAWAPVPLDVVIDPAHGGRWTSLRTGDREWLWTNPDREIRRARAEARPGEAFVDAGGVEECIPTVRGRPDHGGVWALPWGPVRGSVPGPAGPLSAPFDLDEGRCTLRRTVEQFDGSIRVGYLIGGPPGAGFVHAVHALLDLSPTARLEAEGQGEVTLLDRPRTGETSAAVWPSGLDRFGPDDGSAVCAVLVGCHRVTVTDGRDRLTLAWQSADEPSLCSMLLWRNLGGWPETAPYRSVGIEPMLGRAADLSRADADDVAHLGPDGTLRWSLTLTAYRHC